MDELMERQKSKRRGTTIRCVAAATITAIVAYAALASQPRRFGPVECPPCTLHTPYPNRIVMETLDRWVAYHLGGMTLDYNKEAIRVKDVVTVCSRTACVDYQVNNSKQWEAIAERQRKPAGGSGSGRGGGTGRGGDSGPVSGGSHGGGGGRTGSVTVGPYKPPRPTHEN